MGIFMLHDLVCSDFSIPLSAHFSGAGLGGLGLLATELMAITLAVETLAGDLSVSTALFTSRLRYYYKK